MSCAALRIANFKNSSVIHAHFVRSPRFFLGPVQAYRAYNNRTKPGKERERKRGIMNLETLKELYVNELRDLYNAENQLIKALPKMAKGASSDQLKEAFEKHLEQTKGHVQRLEQVFQELGEKTKGKICQAMRSEERRVG